MNSHQFLRHFERFLDSFPLAKNWKDPQTKCLIKVSGGVDSMVLLHLLLRSRGAKNLDILHYNHGTRENCQKEETLVQAIAKSYQCGFITCHFELSFKLQNFEQVARLMRKEHLLTLAPHYDLIFEGHHLDDSFEWSTMQALKVSDYKKCLGIPALVIDPKLQSTIVRPLMCLSKNQIINFAHEHHIQYFEDESNGDLRFLRNYVRHQIIPKIKERFPNYLKHYVDQKNAQAHALSIHLESRAKKLFPLQKKYLACGGLLLRTKQNPQSIHLYREEMRELLLSYALPPSGRSKIHRNLTALIDSIQTPFIHGEKSFRGPYSFPSRLVVFWFSSGVLYLGNEQTFSFFKHLDATWAELLQQHSTDHQNTGQILLKSQTPSRSIILKTKKITSSQWPVLIKSRSQKQKKGHPFFPLTSRLLKKTHIQISIGDNWEDAIV